MAKIYVFYCLICGSKFSVKRNDAKTCSKECRVALSQLQKHGSYDADDELSDIEVVKVDKMVEQVKNGGVITEKDGESGIPYFRKSKNKKNQ